MHDHKLATMELNRYLYVLLSGTDPEISERGVRKPNSRKGGPEFDFSVQLSVIFLQISYKYSTKRGGGGGPSGPSPKSAPGFATRHVGIF